MVPRNFIIGIALGKIVWFSLAAGAAGAPLVPASVAPGSPYHLVFVTQDPRDATSLNIGDYNTFVNQQAILNPGPTGANMGVMYAAIASTPTVDAIANASVSAPVYNFQGELIANGSVDLWDGNLANDILYDQFGVAGFPDVWTGSQDDGLKLAGFELGSSNPGTGLAFNANSMWIEDATSPNGIGMRLYAISEMLVAPGATNVPEPTSIALWLIGLASLAVARRLLYNPSG